jgi:hypothetical protein
MSKHSDKNEGIQAGSVHADVMAVGHGARAIKKVTVQPGQRRELEELLTALGAALDARVTEPAARAVLEEDLSALRSCGAEAEVAPDRVADLLRGLTGKLKLVGNAVGEAAEIAGPLIKIAALFGLAL